MSIIRNYRDYTPICDICGDELEPGFSFYHAIDIMEAYGWKKRQIDGEWYDICINCSEDMLEKRKSKG